MNGKDKSVLGLIGSGFFVVLPVLLVGMMLGRIFRTLLGVIHPLMDALPGELFREPAVRFLAVCAAVAGLLLLLGWLARTAAGRRIGRWLEVGLLSRLPLYTVFRNLAGGLAGRDGDGSLRPVMVTVNPGMQQLGFLVEQHADGSGTVFVPSSPNPGSGTVLVVEAGLMRALDVQAHRVFKCLSGWGDGAAALAARSPGRLAEKT